MVYLHSTGFNPSVSYVRDANSMAAKINKVQARYPQEFNELVNFKLTTSDKLNSIREQIIETLAKISKQEEHIENLDFSAEHCRSGKAGRSKKASLVTQIDVHNKMLDQFIKSASILMLESLKYGKVFETVENELDQMVATGEPRVKKGRYIIREIDNPDYAGNNVQSSQWMNRAVAYVQPKRITGLIYVYPNGEEVNHS